MRNFHNSSFGVVAVVVVVFVLVGVSQLFSNFVVFRHDLLV